MKELNKALSSLPIVLTTGLTGCQFAAADDAYIVRLLSDESTTSGEPIRAQLVDFPTASVYLAHPVEETIYAATSHIQKLASALPEVDEELNNLVDSLVEGYFSQQQVSPISRNI